MTRMTITEALAELHVVEKRIESKQQFVINSCVMDSRIKDPNGDSKAAVATATQAVADLYQRRIDIREAIAKSNFTTQLTVGGITRTVHNWLVWRREVQPGLKGWVNGVERQIAAARFELHKILNQGTQPGVLGLEIHADEELFRNMSGSLGDAEARLDGQLSLSNATTFVEFA